MLPAGLLSTLMSLASAAEPPLQAGHLEIQARRAVAEHLDRLPDGHAALALDRVEAWLHLAARSQVEQRSDIALTAVTTACDRWATLLEQHPQFLGWEPARQVWEPCRPLLDELPRQAALALAWEIRRGEAHRGELPLEAVRRLRELLARPSVNDLRFGPPLRRWSRQSVVASGEKGFLVLPLPGHELPSGCALVGLSVSFQGLVLDLQQVMLCQRIPDGQPWQRAARDQRDLGERENHLLALRSLGQDGLGLAVRCVQHPPIGTELTVTVLLAGGDPGIGTASLSGLVEAALTAGPAAATTLLAGPEAEPLRHCRQFGAIAGLLTGDAP